MNVENSNLITLNNVEHQRYLTFVESGLTLLFSYSNLPPCFIPAPPLANSKSRDSNCLWALRPLMEASSRGNNGNQINCMSVNRITSSLTCRESGLKLITYAWRNGRMWGNEEEGAAESRKGFSLLVGTPFLTMHWLWIWKPVYMHMIASWT